YTLNDWLSHGEAYAAQMVASAASLADALTAEKVAVFRPGGVATRSHAFALDASSLGGGMATAHRLRAGNLLSSAIGLPTGPDDGVRVGTNEIVRWGAAADDMGDLASLIARALRADDPTSIHTDVAAFRARFAEVGYCIPSSGLTVDSQSGSTKSRRAGTTQPRSGSAAPSSER
ncbi:MAG: hypothetical protein AAGC53_17785, partial [Actinomycetota bacterium]